MSGCAVGISLADVASGPVHDGRTILNRLNEDCMRLVLDYLPVKDLIRSEPVSRHWQGVVHRYLEGVGICVAYQFDRELAPGDVKIQPKNRILEIDEESDKILGALREKWGAYMVYTFCSNRSELDDITLCCPKLKGLAIQMLHFGTGPLSQSQMIFCEKLEHLLLIHLTQLYEFTVYDDWDGKTDKDKRAHSYANVNIARAFISNLKPTKLKSLTVCGQFDFCHFLVDIPCFPELTKLTLQGYSRNIPVLFEKTQKLERLVLMESAIYDKSFTFTHLKHLTLDEFFGAKWFESLANSDMHTLSIFGDEEELVQVAIKLMRTDWRSLSEIKINSFGVTDDDVAAMIAACPILKTLDVAGCCSLSSELVPRAARAARGRKIPLLLKIAGTQAVIYSLDQVHVTALRVNKEEIVAKLQTAFKVGIIRIIDKLYFYMLPTYLRLENENNLKTIKIFQN